MADAVPAKPSQDLVLAVFLHGFKGGADTSVGSLCESQSRETWVLKLLTSTGMHTTALQPFRIDYRTR